MRFAVVGPKRRIIEKQLKAKINKRKPNIVICFGGDGTLLFGELKYPSIPKLFIKHRSECNSCKRHDFSKILKKLTNGNYSIVEMMKLVAKVNNKKAIGMNEINIHYKPPRALRFDLYLDNKTILKNAIGDGVVIATPFGSHAYFRSITRRTFNKGIGIAFNNPVIKTRPIIAKEDSIIKVRVIRGPGLLAADNDKHTIPLKAGNLITIKRHKASAKIIKLNGYRMIIDQSRYNKQ